MKASTKKFLLNNIFSIISLALTFSGIVSGYYVLRQNSAVANAQTIQELQIEQKAAKTYSQERKAFVDGEISDMKTELKEIRKEMGTKDEQMHQRRLIEEILRIQKK